MNEIGLAFGILGVTFLIFGLIVVFAILALIGMCKSFQKAGVAWWKALIPTLNYYIMLKLAGIDDKYMLLMYVSCIPYLGWLALIVMYRILCYRYFECFGCSQGQLVLYMFFPFLGFLKCGSATSEYIGGINCDL